MMRKQKYLLLIALLALLLAGCSVNNDDSRSVVYEDMKSGFERSGLLYANIGIFSRTENADSVQYGECGSGVIIEKKDGMYYALTAAHVVSVPDAQLLVFTANTEMKSEEIPGFDQTVLAPEVYDAMCEAEAVYVAERDDLAVIRFSAGEDLPAIGLADSDPVKEDRILCVGNPQNEWFAVSYGKILSGMERFGEAQGYPSNAMRHSAYIHVGSSGGAAINEEMKLAGITPGGSFSPDGSVFRYGVMIPVSEIRICLEEWKKQ